MNGPAKEVFPTIRLAEAPKRSSGCDTCRLVVENYARLYRNRERLLAALRREATAHLDRRAPHGK